MNARGNVRDSIYDFLFQIGGDASVADIEAAVNARLSKVPASSVRSYLNKNVPGMFERTTRGRYRLRVNEDRGVCRVSLAPPVLSGRSELFHADCFAWMAEREENSIEAIVTDPPYGVVEYSSLELEKLRSGKGGVWRVPPSFDGCQRAPIPRFTTLTEQNRDEIRLFFRKLGAHLERILVPGANVVVASNPLLSHIVASAMTDAGLELRGYLSRLTMTMRGGDRPKNAHEEFSEVSVMPRSQWEPWVVLRKSPEGRIQDNLRKWKTGGFRRLSETQPFGDVIKSRPTSKAEKKIAPHPSLKPQEFLRQVVRASLPLGEGVILDPFAGSGSTLAAAEAVGYRSIGVESDPKFFRIASNAIPKLSIL